MTQQWKLVPREPTDEMGVAGALVQTIPDGHRITQWATNRWPDLLDAAPTYTLTDEEVERVARTLLAEQGDPGKGQPVAAWESQPEAFQQRMLRETRAVLKTFLEDKR